MKRPTSALGALVQRVKHLALPAPPDPPFKFPIQIGDPILRLRAEEVKPEDIKSKKIQELLNSMRFVLSRSKSIGISATQVGVPLRIFMTELTDEGCKEHDEKSRIQQHIEPWPFKVFINPVLEVSDNKTSYYREGCISVLGYSASVPRYVKVKVKGLNQEGEPVTWETIGFAARVIQHELDHLDGMLYTDRMDSKTFEFCQWKKAREQKI